MDFAQRAAHDGERAGVTLGFDRVARLDHVLQTLDCGDVALHHREKLRGEREAVHRLRRRAAGRRQIGRRRRRHIGGGR